MIPSPPPSDMKFGSQFCDLYPEASVDVVNNCTSMCFVWQYNYTDPSGNPAYETIRGCASDIPNMNVPSTDGCPSYLQPSPGGQGYPGGPNAAPGKYSMFIKSLFLINYNHDINNCRDNSSSTNNSNFMALFHINFSNK
uniref:Uncharacterized protein n=1 Tax=Plectus sambesii TaxID=2011161 RepID=A0A914WM53_9BILA